MYFFYKASCLFKNPAAKKTLHYSPQMCRITTKIDYQQFKAGKGPLKCKCYCQNQTLTRWDDIRFAIERENKMVIENISAFQKSCEKHRRYHVTADTCIIGFLSSHMDANMSENYILDEDFDVSSMPDDECVIVTSVPCGRSDKGANRINTFVPTRFLPELAEQETASELEEMKRELSAATNELDQLRIMERMSGLISGMPTSHHQRSRAFRRASVHPSRAVAQNMCKGYVAADRSILSWADALKTGAPKAVPRDDYTCFGCLNYFQPMHFINDCPGQHIADWIPMNRRSAPHGVPSTDRVLVPWDAPECEIARAKWKDANGNLWKPTKLVEVARATKQVGGFKK